MKRLDAGTRRSRLRVSREDGAGVRGARGAGARSGVARRQTQAAARAIDAHRSRAQVERRMLCDALPSIAAVFAVAARDSTSLYCAVI